MFNAIIDNSICMSALSKMTGDQEKERLRTRRKRFTLFVENLLQILDCHGLRGIFNRTSIAINVGRSKSNSHT